MVHHYISALIHSSLFLTPWQILYCSNSQKFTLLRMHSTLHVLPRTYSSVERFSTLATYWNHPGTWEISSLGPIPRNFDVTNSRAVLLVTYLGYFDVLPGLLRCVPRVENHPQPDQDYPTQTYSTDLHLLPQFPLSLVLFSFLPGLEDDMYLLLQRPPLMKVASLYTMLIFSFFRFFPVPPAKLLECSLHSITC